MMMSRQQRGCGNTASLGVSSRSGGDKQLTHRQQRLCERQRQRQSGVRRSWVGGERRRTAAVVAAAAKRSNALYEIAEDQGSVSVSVEEPSGAVGGDDLFGDVPVFMWVGLGVVLCAGFQKFMGWLRNAAMKAAMQQMMKQAGGGAGMPGMPGMPGSAGMPGASPFGMPPGGFAPPAGGFNPPAGGFKPPPMPSMSPPAPAKTQQSAPTSPPPITGVPPIGATANSAGASTAAPSSTAAATATDSDSEAGAGGGGEQATVFEDVVVNGAVEDGSDTSNPETGAEGVIPDVVAEGGETAAEDSSAKMDMLENLLKNPQMQEMVYPYLPENMRNPQTFEFMLNNPTYRKQLEDMLPSMGAVPNVPPDIEGAFQNVNPEAKAQFEALGTTPDELLAKLQSKPDLMQKMYNPKVMQAFMDMSKDPNNIQNVFKYQNDPEVWPVLMELTQLTQPGMGAPPGMGGS